MFIDPTLGKLITQEERIRGCALLALGKEFVRFYKHSALNRAGDGISSGALTYCCICAVDAIFCRSPCASFFC